MVASLLPKVEVRHAIPWVASVFQRVGAPVVILALKMLGFRGRQTLAPLLVAGMTILQALIENPLLRPILCP